MKQMPNDHISPRVVEFILTREPEELSTLSGQKIAAALSLDLLNLTRAFESDQHISLDRFIVREKMYRAFFLIEKNQGITIEELAKKMGFLQTREFAKEFETLFLIDPGKYKELVRLS
jgi:transcriptional regulator GlxA family with amidase domain